MRGVTEAQRPEETTVFVERHIHCTGPARCQQCGVLQRVGSAPAQRVPRAVFVSGTGKAVMMNAPAVTVPAHVPCPVLSFFGGVVTLKPLPV